VLPLYRLKDQKPSVELKGSVFPLSVVRLLSGDLEDIECDLREKIAMGPRFFANAPVVLDLDRLGDNRSDFNFPALGKLLKELALVPVGIRHATPSQQEAAIKAGFAIVKGGEIRELSIAPEPKGVKDGTRAKADEPLGSEVIQAPPKPPEVTEPLASRVRPKTVDRPVRSGQQIYAKGGDLVVLAAVNAGAEVVADGNVHIYGPLRGRALAGAQGDREARIFCQNMAAELVAIAGRYQVLEELVPREVRGRAVQVYLDGEKLRFELLT